MKPPAVEPLPYRWLEPLARPRDRSALVRLYALPALIVGGVAWWALPRIRLPVFEDSGFELVADAMLILVAFELAFIAMSVLDRRRVTLDENGVRLAAACGLLGGPAIPLASIAGVRLERGWGANSILRLLPSTSGAFSSGDAALGLGMHDRKILNLQDHFRTLGVSVDEGAAKSEVRRRARNAMAGHAIFRALFVCVLLLRVVNDFLWLGNHRTNGTQELDPTIDCITAKPGRGMLIDVANLQQFVDVDVESRTFAAPEVDVTPLGGSRTRLRLHGNPPQNSGLEELVTVRSRSPGGSIQSGWTTFNPDLPYAQGTRCS